MSLKSTGSALALCALLSAGAAVLFTLSRGEIRSAYTQVALSRHSDIQGYAWHRVQGTVEHTNALYAGYARNNISFGPTLAVLLARAGFSFPLALALVAMLYRAIFGIGLALLAYACSRRLWAGLLAVPLAFAFPQAGLVYAHSPAMAVGGILAHSLFAAALGLCLLGYRRAAIAAWLLMLWVHPVTFLCWAPLFWGLYLLLWYDGEVRWPRLARWFPWLLLLGPAALGLLAGLLEAAGLMPYDAGEAYWALVRFRTQHTVFLFTDRYGLPLNMLSLSLALVLLGPGKVADPSLGLLNRLAGLLGLGVVLLSLLCVETGWSSLAAMALPLRFELILAPLLLANLLAIALGQDQDPGARALAAGYGALFVLGAFEPLLAAAFWALAHRWYLTQGRSAGPGLAILVAGLVLVLLYLVLMPARHGLAWKLEQLPLTLGGVAVLASVFAASLGLRRLGASAIGVLFSVAVLLLAPFNLDLHALRWLGPELSALASGTPESSAEQRAVDWIQANLPPGAATLCHDELPLHLVTHLKTSVNYDLMGFFIYAPDQARLLDAEIRRIYGVSPAELVARGKFAWERPLLRFWVGARDRVLGRGAAARYRYVVEPFAAPPSGDGSIVFENAYVRVYNVAGAG